MADITGANAIAALKVAGTWGTAVTCVAGDQLSGVTITHSENAEALQVPPIGSGDIMVASTDRGAVAPSFSIEGPLGYNTPQLVAIAQCFGTATGPVTYDAGAYAHSITVNETANAKYFTMAFQGHSATAGAMEYPTAVCTGVNLSYPAPVDYIQARLDCLANKQELASTTNTYLSLNSCTASNSKRAAWDLSDKLLINAQAGAALDDDDKLEVQSVVIDFQRPQEHAREAKAAAGNGVPIATGDYPLACTITVTLRKLSDWTYFTAAQAGTEYKLEVTKRGALINIASYYGITFAVPRCKIIQSPEYNLAQAGNNPCTIVFQAMVAASNPTGMISTYPYITLVNDRNTNLLA